MAKKEVNVELNMTPFIGLFALLVVMLLLTAVWNQLAVLSTDTSSSTASDTPPPQDQVKQVQLSITIMPTQLEMAENQEGTNIPHVGGEVDKMRMVQILNIWKDKHGEKKTDVILNTENSVPYNKLIAVFDTLVGNGFPDVGVNTQ